MLLPKLRVSSSRLCSKRRTGRLHCIRTAMDKLPPLVKLREDHHRQAEFVKSSVQRSRFPQNPDGPFSPIVRAWIAEQSPRAPRAL